jgi:heme-degrading monooxygenase HmoA
MKTNTNIIYLYSPRKALEFPNKLLSNLRSERKITMKPITTILAITLLNLLPLTVVHAQGTPKSNEKSAAPAGAGKRTDVYHVHFTKAALGKAAQLGDWLKTPDPKAPMPDHFIVLRHQDGDAWDYVVITHLGTKATVEAAGTAVPPDKRDLSAWHNDTFVNGPSWEEFARAMGIDSDSASKSSGSVYSVSYYRPASGHREQLEKALSEAPGANDTSAGNVLMQHLEGGPWTFLTIARYNSWDDFATGEKNSVAQTTKKDSPWSRMRDHTDFHTDTLTDRISP